MKQAERIVISGIVLCMLGGVLALGVVIWRAPAAPPVSAVNQALPPPASLPETDERRYYPNPITFTIAGQLWRASVANTLPTRIQGLSNTPFLPVDMVKWFDFDAVGPHSIWMKDMQYPLDIVWLTRDGVVVHIEENISPDTFPTAFSSPTPAWYVLEANVGFVASTSLKLGDQITPPVY